MLSESIEVHETLNKALFDENNSLKKSVKDRLLEIATFFIENLDIDINVADIRLYGSNCSYNYTKDSDVDLHIVTNFDLIDADQVILRAYFDSQKALFNKNYDVKIKGYDVEMYVEDMNSTPTSNGIYSVMKDEWIKFPNRIDTNVISVDISNDVNEWQRKINQIIKTKSLDKITGLINDLYIMRKDSIATDGEYGKGNLVFKEIRNIGLLDKLKDARNDAISNDLTLEQLNNISENMSLGKIVNLKLK